jgi:hypothetical protein
MAITHFAPSPGRFGEEYATLTALMGNMTSAGVVTYRLPAFARLSYFKRLTLVCGTAAVGTGALTVAIVKTRIGGGTVVISNEVTMFGRTAGLAFWMDLAAGITDGDATLNEGESLALRFTNTGGTVSTQPAQLFATLELAILR